MRKRRPTIVTVVAILNLIFGIIGCLFSIVGIAAIVSGGYRKVGEMVVNSEVNSFQQKTNGYTNADLYNYFGEHLPGYQTAEVVKELVDPILTLLLLVSGIGLLRMARWGRGVGLLYAVLSFGMGLLTVFWIVSYLHPAIDGFFAELATRTTEQQRYGNQFASISIKIAYVFVPSIALVYPLVVLGILSLPSVRRAFRGEPEAPKAPPPSFEPHSEDATGGDE